MSEPTVHTAPSAAEFDWLMSLALDDQLDDDEQMRFEAWLADDPDLAESWRAWQWIDSEFTATPAVTPPSGFVQRFELRMAEAEKERQQRVLLLSSAAALLAVALVFALTTGIGVFVFLTQGQWVGGQVRALAMAYTSVNLWLATLGESVNALIDTPQAQVAGGLYVLLLIMLVVGWVQLLRRSAHQEQALPASVE
ncbi:MAG TPA: hypothetical protein DCL15_19560 [Chloroflexi bacterium]|nr:hypothetical protein [Chloroflexota bacterium]HHW86196.1 hypothetical protein [Chloroflexota bacterium]